LLIPAIRLPARWLFLLIDLGYFLGFGLYWPMNSICLDGKFLPQYQPVLQADNRSYRYGDGLFETMKMVGGQILLDSFHFDRLFRGMHLLRYIMTPLIIREKLVADISQLCKINQCEQQARIRLSVFAGNGGLYDGHRSVHYLIESQPLPGSANEINENGLIIGVFPDARKSCDPFSNLKSANFLTYSLAANYAKENKWDDCLVKNTYDRIADASIANLFIIKDETIITPSLEEGCVAGVMRRWLLEQVKEQKIIERPVSKQDIFDADELFLTNAVSGIRWVKQFGDKIYPNHQTNLIYKHYIKPLFS
jgi:branched-chain amino acid aminotransferase